MNRRILERPILRPLVGSVLALVGSSLLAFALETWLGLSDASSVYLLAVAAVAIAWGTVPAIATAVGGFVTYNFLFLEPRLSLIVAGPQELLTLLLLLGLGILIGRLAGMQRDRARQAARREREARALFAINRLLSTPEAGRPPLAAAAERLAIDAGMATVWVALGSSEGQERTVAGSSTTLPETPATYALLRREADEEHAEWLRIHSPTSAPAMVRRRRTPGVGDAYRVQIRWADERLGSLWAVRDAKVGVPHLEETRLLAAAADQMAQALHRGRLDRQAVELEIARRSDELKSALLASVSHDLRTPLAAIRAAAGSIADPAVSISVAQARITALTIDEEAQRLNGVIGNLLDMGRIESGDITPDLEAIPVADAIDSVVRRLRPILGERSVKMVVPSDTPPIRADATLLDQVLANLLENVARHTSTTARVRVAACLSDDGHVRLTVEDSGDGVRDEALAHLFERFYRTETPRESSGRGSGLGLAVVRGFVGAMQGTVVAHRSALGGLAVTVQLAADAPPHDRQSAK